MIDDPREQPDPLLIPEAQEGLGAYLDQFDREIWPIFKARGFSHDVAIVAWYLNRIWIRMDDFGSDDPDKDAPWRPPT